MFFLLFFLFLKQINKTWFSWTEEKNTLFSETKPGLLEQKNTLSLVSCYLLVGPCQLFSCCLLVWCFWNKKFSSFLVVFLFRVFLLLLLETNPCLNGSFRSRRERWFVATCFKNRSSWRTACFKNRSSSLLFFCSENNGSLLLVSRTAVLEELLVSRTALLLFCCSETNHWNK